MYSPYVIPIFVGISLLAAFSQVKITRLVMSYSNTNISTIPVFVITLFSGIIMTLIGFFSAFPMNLKIPILQNLLIGRFKVAVLEIWKSVQITVPLTLFIGIIFFFYYYQIFGSSISKDFAILENFSKNVGLDLRIISGGIYEEIIFRWGFLSSIYLLITSTTLMNTIFAFLLANLISAMLFGLAHLPGSQAIGQLLNIDISSKIILNSLGLNTIIGIYFGYLYLNLGLESSMIAHSILHIMWSIIYKLEPFPIQKELDLIDNSNGEKEITIQ